MKSDVRNCKNTYWPTPI